MTGNADALTTRLAAAVLVGAYVICGAAWLTGQSTRVSVIRFGFDQLQRFGWAGLAGLAVAVALAGPIARSPFARRVLDRGALLAGAPAGAAALWAASALGFWSFRSRSMNADGAAFQAVFEREVPARGVFATHDEILEFAAHSSAWHFIGRRAGWDVPTTYQVLSCAAGGVFVVLAARYARLAAPARAGALTLLLLLGGYVQLFFGDVENYTLTAVALLAYFLSAERFLQRRTSVVWPSAWLAIAMMCHLLAGFLIPSLLYLWWTAHRRGTGGALIRSVTVFAGVIAGTLAVAHVFWGLPIDRWVESHASGHGGQYATVLARPTPGHVWTQLNLLLLLAPAAVFLPWASFARGVAGERRAHLVLASAGMLLFLLVWFPALGPLNDWNLFANVAVPVNLLVWTTMLEAPGVAARRTAATTAALAGGLHTVAWVLGQR